ncbi:unnamed protein product [Rotaria socialis]
MNEFIERIRHYNSAQICGLVWNANVIAYRCKTCSISPCMSICAQCFQNGNHEGHNFNMFESQAGGACIRFRIFKNCFINLISIIFQRNALDSDHTFALALAKYLNLRLNSNGLTITQ